MVGPFSNGGHTGFGIPLSTRAARALLDWVPVNLWTNLYASQQSTEASVLFVISVRSTSDCNFPEAQEESHRNRPQLLQKVVSQDSLVESNYFNHNLC